MPRSDQQYLSWSDVSSLIGDIEMDYPCSVRVTMCRAADGPRDGTHWFVEAVDAHGGEFSPRCWRGRRYPNVDNRTVPGVLVNLLLGLAQDLEIRLHPAEQLPLEVAAAAV
jgi:hypothetical protein